MIKHTAKSQLKGAEMKKKLSDIQKLKRQIETCLFDGLRLAFFLPNQEIRNPLEGGLPAVLFQCMKVCVNYDGRHQQISKGEVKAVNDT